MTYNVRYFAHATRGIASTAMPFRRIARAIARLDPTPDLVCLQEVETRSLRAMAINKPAHPTETQLDRLAAELDLELRHAHKTERYTPHYFAAHAYRLSEKTNIYTTGLAVLTKASLRVDHHNAKTPHDITHRRGVKQLKQTRVCAHVAFEHESGARFDVFNTHLSLPNVFAKDFWTGEARMGFGKNQLVEAKMVADFVEREKRSDAFVVVGDFNSLPGSPVDAYLREERGFVEAFSAARGLSVGESRAFPTAGFLNLRMHLDHVYASPNVRFLDFDATEPFGERAGAFHGLSDHVPLIARCAC
ncbi:MAG TPA: endonuclease/exonuclease/phosphatase family protein [Byssovorax sp.]|jgi:endonuclease/exonuclease/phosphatase family metal-dependent hydrolase